MTTPNPPLCLTSLKILGDYWTLRIIDELANSELRFCELERRLEGSNTATLTKRLRNMRQEGLIERHEASRADVAYRLSDLGREALPLLAAVNHFSEATKQVKMT